MNQLTVFVGNNSQKEDDICIDQHYTELAL